MYKLIIENKISFSCKGKKKKKKISFLIKKKGDILWKLSRKTSKSDDNLKIYISRTLYRR